MNWELKLSLPMSCGNSTTVKHNQKSGRGQRAGIFSNVQVQNDRLGPNVASGATTNGYREVHSRNRMTVLALRAPIDTRSAAITSSRFLVKIDIMSSKGCKKEFRVATTYPLAQSSKLPDRLNDPGPWPYKQCAIHGTEFSRRPNCAV
jgi:hypothetical protein